jgi:hypothetical protein
MSKAPREEYINLPYFLDYDHDITDMFDLPKIPDMSSVWDTASE